MATDATGMIPVAYPYSFAHRTGSRVRIVLDLDASAELAGTAPVLRLSNQKRRVRGLARVSANGDRLRLEATVPRRELTPGVWQLALRPGPQHPRRRVQARLLVGGNRPVALLPGRPPRAGVQPPRSTAGTGRARRAFEAALRPLPDRRAAQVRRLARRAVRRVSG